MTLGSAWRDARAEAHRQGAARRGSATSIPLWEAIGTTLAAEVVAAADVPGHSASAMDGWAVAGDGPWHVGAPIFAGGSPDPAPIRAGSARPITTGAPAPTGTVAILRSEEGRVGTDGLLTGLIDPDRRHLRYRGEEILAGDVLLKRGRLLTPAGAAVAAAAGLDRVTVTAAPEALLAILGDEIIEAGVPRPGRVRDVFSGPVAAILHRAGLGRIRTIRVPDDLEGTVRAFADDRPPLIVSTGGTAQGSADHLRAGLDRLGAVILLERIAIRPGRPALLARHGDTLHLALPGNPLAAFVTLTLFGLPLVDGMLGRPLAEPRSVRAGVDLPNDRTVDAVVTCRMTPAGAVPTSHQSAAMLRGLADADHLVLVPPGGIVRDEDVSALPLPWDCPDDSGGSAASGGRQRP